MQKSLKPNENCFKEIHYLSTCMVIVTGYISRDSLLEESLVSSVYFCSFTSPISFHFSLFVMGLNILAFLTLGYTNCLFSSSSPCVSCLCVIVYQIIINSS